MTTYPALVRRMSWNELWVAALSVSDDDPNTPLRGAARGEYTERRAVHLASKFQGVRAARRATLVEDREMATDVVVTMCDGTVVQLQVKSRRKRHACAAVHRAEQCGAVIVHMPPELPDDIAAHRIGVALGLRVPHPHHAITCYTKVKHRRLPAIDVDAMRWEDDGGAPFRSAEQ